MLVLPKHHGACLAQALHNNGVAQCRCRGTEQLRAGCGRLAGHIEQILD